MNVYETKTMAERSEVGGVPPALQCKAGSSRICGLPPPLWGTPLINEGGKGCFVHPTISLTFRPLTGTIVKTISVFEKPIVCHQKERSFP